MHRLTVLILLLGSLAGQTMAEDADKARWYRFYNDKNQPTITDRITEEHIARGYDALDQSMQVLRHVPAQRALTAEENIAAKAQRAAASKRADDDKQLLRLYSKPADAEHTRDRQTDAIQLRIDFSSSSLNRLRETRAKEAQRAAALERTGKPVPKPLADSISNYDKQIQQLQTEIQTRKAEQEKVRQEFAPIIQRLNELTTPPASNMPRPTPTVTPPKSR
ncbi:MAG TPA: hypothetical protein DF427_08285 [Moraxellaceae bacterium]|nr:hypothetical protein [Moraxellaceae bacterium]